MDLVLLDNLVQLRLGVLSERQQDSPRQEEIFKKLDDLIIIELDKLTPQETE